jgi:hypothetical protein
MPNQNLLTYGAKVSSVAELYYAPVAVVPPNYTVPLSTNYVFLAKPDPWTDDLNPPTPKQDQAFIKSVFKTVFVMKLVTSSDISPVIPRVDWSANTVYDYYQDTVDMFARDINNNLILNFYVKNQYDQVFKCLWNSNGALSVDQPYFEPGSYNTQAIYTGPNDGYKWHYMFTVDASLKIKFMDSTWLPIPVQGSLSQGLNIIDPLLPNNITGETPGYGDIEVINVLQGGSGYDPANAAISVVITGDGYGATATATANNGSIISINVTNPGQNYTYANAAIISAIGSNAVLQSPVSPVGGHGFDSTTELGCVNAMYSVEFNGAEETGGVNMIPTDITYHQLGIIVNPTALDTIPYPANGAIYQTTTNLVVASGFGAYQTDEKIYQSTDSTLGNAYWVGTVLSFDATNNVLYVLNTTGALNLNAPIYSTVSGTTRTLLSYSTPNMIPLSGYMAYIENRSGITRSPDGIEQVKIVLGY